MDDLNPLFLNRMVLVLRPLKPFLDWLQEVDPDPEGAGRLTLEILQQDRNVWLIPPLEEPEEADAWVLARWRGLFELELSDWISDPARWPKPLTPDLFARFFAIEVHSIVQDIADMPLAYEEWADEDDDDEEPPALQ